MSVTRLALALPAVHLKPSLTLHLSAATHRLPCSLLAHSHAPHSHPLPHLLNISTHTHTHPCTPAPAPFGFPVAFGVLAPNLLALPPFGWTLAVPALRQHRRPPHCTAFLKLPQRLQTSMGLLAAAGRHPRAASLPGCVTLVNKHRQLAEAASGWGGSSSSSATAGSPREQAPAQKTHFYQPPPQRWCAC